MVYASIDALDEFPGKPLIKIEMPPCSEEIVLDDQKIYVLFESAAEKYLEGTDGKGKVWLRSIKYLPYPENLCFHNAVGVFVQDGKREYLICIKK